jgi:hypothetical protein
MVKLTKTSQAPPAVLLLLTIVQKNKIYALWQIAKQALSAEDIVTNDGARITSVSEGANKWTVPPNLSDVFRYFIEI